MEANFYQKYIKYKAKYNDLRRLIGGQVPPTPKTIVSLVGTHNGRIRCLVDSLNLGYDTKAKFKNCAILKLTISQNNFSISLEYNGELSHTENGKTKDKYFVRPVPVHIQRIVETSVLSSNEVVFQPFVTSDNAKLAQVIQSLNLKNADLQNYNYTFYIIRHGDGEHNKAKVDGTKLAKTLSGELEDAKLTLEGVNQATEAGNALVNFILNGSIVDYLFASDLIRTRQTLKKIYDIVKPKSGIKNEKIYIVPCLHELDFKKSNVNPITKQSQNCDAQQFGQAIENKNKCPRTLSKDKYCPDTDGLPNDWTNYFDFYGNGTRTAPGMRKKQCRNTNAFAEMAIMMEMIHKR